MNVKPNDMPPELWALISTLSTMLLAAIIRFWEKGKLNRKHRRELRALNEELNLKHKNGFND